MKKYLIHFMSVDAPSVDDGINAGTGVGILDKTFDTKEDAEKYLEETLIPEDQANLEDCYGISEDEELAENYEFSVENGSYDRKLLVVYDTKSSNELNTTIYEVVEVNF